MQLHRNQLAQKSFSSKFLIFIGAIFLGLCVTIALAIPLSGSLTEPTLTRVTTAIQNFTLFILPALILATLFGGNPITYLEANRAPNIGAFLAVIVGLIVAVPMMNVIIDWNSSITLPESLSGLESWLKAREESAQKATLEMLQMHNIGEMFLLILILGILTGIGEEFAFRGVLQRIFLEKFRNPHVAIWAVAILFSAFHFQFYGFVPRMLLGAFFGYLLIWSGSIWLAVAAHATNNAMAVISVYIGEGNALDTLGITDGTYWTAGVSLVLTVMMIVVLRYLLSQPKNSLKKRG